MLLRYHYDVKMICLIFFYWFQIQFDNSLCEFDLKLYTIEHMVCCLLVCLVVVAAFFIYVI